jgi:hypothetical protein
MKYYRCYFLDVNFHIVKAVVIKAPDDADAIRQGRAVFNTNMSSHCGFEVWHSARWIYSYPGQADALSEQIAKGRPTRLDFDDVKNARLRELRLEMQAAAGKLYQRRRRRHVDEQHVVANRVTADSE